MNDVIKLINFSIQLDDMKKVLRQTQLIGSEQYEDDAQHSYHIASMAILMQKYAKQPIDLEKALTMLLFHDVVELKVGDTFCYDANGQNGKFEREHEAAKSLYGQLPTDIGDKLLRLWLEFEERETPEAKFANALDRAQPIFNNYYGGGGSWKRHGVRYSQVLRRIDPVQDGCPELYSAILALVDDAVAKKWIIDDTE